jgi:phosphoribosylaminoimidazole-succinocarboxamide synthase
MKGKAEYSTTINCVVSQILKASGIPVAYQKRINSDSFLAQNCQMIHLEVVARRFAVGSYLSRHPSFKRPDTETPYRFNEVVVEFFLKTTGGEVYSKNGSLIRKIPVDNKTGRLVDDPLISNSESVIWLLHHPKLPDTDDDSLLCSVYSSDILPEGVTIERMEKITRQVFLLLEETLSYVDLKLIDFKLEFGVNLYGELLLADVIDNDSWRLRTSDWRELSKELFRQNQEMDVIEQSYEFVAKTLEKNFPINNN